MKTNISFSFCIGVFNEEKIITNAISKIDNNLTKLLGKSNYEIIIVDNGSEDATLEKLKKNKNKNLRFFSISKRAHGLALKTAIEKSRYQNVAITGIDLPFGFDDFKTAIKLWKHYDIIFGSKGHPESSLEQGFKRKCASAIFRLFLKHLFKLQIADPQGSIFFKKKKITPLLKYCQANNGFFTAEIAIAGNIKKLRMKEIPVFSKNYNKRKSKYKILKDGRKMFITMLTDYFYFRKIS